MARMQRAVGYGMAAVGLTLATLPAAAQTYPVKPVRLIVPFGAGATTDIVARIFAGRMSEVMGQPLIVDNRPGAGGVIGLETAARATPDGYTLCLCGVGQSIAPALYRRLPYDHVRDFLPISLVAALPNVLVVHPSVPVKSVAEFVAYARANPGRLKYASSGVGASPHLSMELFRSLAGIDVVHVPYKLGAQGATDLVAGHVHTSFNNLPTALPYIRAGRVRPLAVTSARRSEQLPEIPTVIESGYPGFEVTVWQGFCAPAGTSAAIVAKLHGYAMRGLDSADLRARYAEQGVEAVPMTPAAFAAFIRAETDKWGRAARAAGVTPG